jgi:hypothetical protein
MDGSWHRPIGVQGWTHVVFRRERDGARRVLSLDEMLAHLDAWDRTADRRMTQRRSASPSRQANERRAISDDRRAPGVPMDDGKREPPGVAAIVEPPRSTEPAADLPATGPARSRDAAPQSAEAPPSRHAH